MLLIAPAAGQATDMYGEGFQVHQVNAAVYEAVSEGLLGGAAFWCVAGKFVEIELKAHAGTEIYVARGGGPSVTTDRKSAAQFTIDPKAAGITPAGPSDDLNTLVVGDHMTAGAARILCSTG
jgi:hypothetical protein